LLLDRQMQVGEAAAALRKAVAYGYKDLDKIKKSISKKVQDLAGVR